MNRRTFLSATAAAFAASALPYPARADLYVGGMDLFSPAFVRAQKAGKSLLCLIVPEDPAERWKMGGAFGDMLLISDDSTMADLAQVEVICVGADIVQAFLTGRGEDDSCLLALVETGGQAASRPCDSATLPSPLVPFGFEGTELPQGHNYAEVRARRMGSLVNRAVALNSDMTKRRASECIQAVGRGLAKSVINAVEKGRSVAPERVDKVAPILAWHAVSASDEVRVRTTRLMANAARTRLVHRAPVGSEWVIPATEGSDARPGPSGAVPYLSFDVTPKGTKAKGKG